MLLERLYRLMALRTTYISRVACPCFASWLGDIFCHARTDFRESDWLLPGRADSIGSDRACLPTFSTPLAPVNRYSRCHWSSAMHPFPLPIAMGLNPSASEDNRLMSSVLDVCGILGRLYKREKNEPPILQEWKVKRTKETTGFVSTPRWHSKHFNSHQQIVVLDTCGLPLIQEWWDLLGPYGPTGGQQLHDHLTGSLFWPCDILPWTQMSHLGLCFISISSTICSSLDTLFMLECPRIWSQQCAFHY